MQPNLRILSRALVALCMVATLAGVSPVAAQQKKPATPTSPAQQKNPARPTSPAQQTIPATPTSDEDCDYKHRCGKVQLPDGIVLWGGCQLTAKRGTAEAAIADLEDPIMGSCPTFKGVVLRDDGTIVVQASWDDNTVFDAVTVKQARLHARLEHASALQLAKQKKLREAEAALERALAHEPDFEEAAFELARVRVGLGQPERAADALAPLAGKEPLRTYAHVLGDRKLQPVADQAPFVALRARQAGTARITSVKTRLIAFSAERNLFAVVQRRIISGVLDTDHFATNLVVFDAAGVHAMLPLHEEIASKKRLEGQEPAAIRRRIQVANRFLSDFGFVVADAERVTFQTRPTGTDAAPFPKAKLSLTYRDGMARLVRGDEVLQERRLHGGCSGPDDDAHICQYPPHASWAAWIPALETALFEWETSRAEDHDAITTIEIWPLRGPGGRAVMSRRDTPPR